MRAVIYNVWVIAAVYSYIGFVVGRRVGRYYERLTVEKWERKTAEIFDLLDNTLVALGKKKVDKHFDGWVNEDGKLDRTRIIKSERTEA